VRRGSRAEAGQASLELLGALPAVLVLGLACFQVLAVGYTLVLAGNAAEAGALAVAGGGDGAEAARSSLPGWSRARGKVDVEGGRVRVRLHPPSPLRVVSRKLEVQASAAVE
jgi:hypothetical protein